jgi:alcohol dehydrogenase
MKAAQINSYGGVDALTVNNDTDKPSAGPGQVLVEVYAAGLNPFDWKVREGYMKDFIPLTFPATLGGDVAGVVAAVGEGVDGFEPGQAVYGQAGAASGQGSYAEFTPVKAEQLANKPESINFVEAAALPLAGTSAYQALVDHMNLQAGQKVLIHGAAGGIGSYAVQIAKHIGANVVATASAEEADFVKSLGASEVIDYKNQDFSELVRDADAVFDTVGGETNSKSYQALKPGGVLVSMVEEANQELTQKYNLRAIHQSSKTTPERLAKVAELVDQGAIKIQVDKVFPLDQAAEALEYLKTGHPKGKVVLQVK